jgi:hypothetical protein
MVVEPLLPRSSPQRIIYSLQVSRRPMNDYKRLQNLNSLILSF